MKTQVYPRTIISHDVNAQDEYVIQKSDKRPGWFEVLNLTQDRIDFESTSYQKCQDFIDPPDPDES